MDFNGPEQDFINVTRFQRRARLSALLKENGYGNDAFAARILMIVVEKKSADFFAAYLSETLISSISIQGDRKFHEREEALADFHSGLRKVLVVTRGVLQGIIIEPNVVTHVINFDPPESMEEYNKTVERFGARTATFVEPEDDFELMPEDEGRQQTCIVGLQKNRR